MGQCWADSRVASLSVVDSPSVQPCSHPSPPQRPTYTEHCMPLVDCKAGSGWKWDCRISGEREENTSIPRSCPREFNPSPIARLAREDPMERACDQSVEGCAAEKQCR